jgi:hypothetical protein
MREDPEFVGNRLLFLVLDLEAVVARHAASFTPLGREVVRLAEAALSAGSSKMPERV